MRHINILMLWLLLSLSASAQQFVTEVEVDEAVDDSVAVAVDEDIITAADTLVVDTVAVDSSLVWPHNLSAHLSQMLKSDMFSTSQVGMMVYDLSTDSVIFAYNERQRMRPASTMKMINAVASLDRLGGSFLFRTQLMTTGQRDSLTYRGNIYLVGGMDPLFNGDDMRAFVESLRQQGVDTIRGNVYADQSMKDADLWGEGWCWDDDNPSLVPLLINGENQFMKRFCQELKKSGIVLVGDTLVGAAPANARLLCSRTHTIDQVLQKMMKKSDNLFAECLFYQLARQAGTRGPATAAMGRQMVNNLVKKVGLNSRDYYVADGSGLSLYNYVSPELEVRFLRYAWQNDNISTHLLPSLPIAGVDGTLQTRMTKGTARGNVRAKTGTVSGVSSLAGFCVAPNGHQLCFSIINMGQRKAVTARVFQDKVCQTLTGVGDSE